MGSGILLILPLAFQAKICKELLVTPLIQCLTLGAFVAVRPRRHALFARFFFADLVLQESARVLVTLVSTKRLQRCAFFWRCRRFRPLFHLRHAASATFRIEVSHDPFGFIRLSV